MHLSMRVVATLTTLLAQAASKTVNVNVGQQGIAFTPDTIQANIGDTIQFSFYNNHSVVESTFAAPCQPLPNGFYSGFIESCLNCGAAPQHFVLTVKDTNPHWFYCSQKGHCAAGMVGVINPLPNLSGQLQSYAASAANTKPTASPKDMSPHSAPIGGFIATSSPSPDLSFTSTLSGFATVKTPSATQLTHSRSPSSSTTTTTPPSESLLIYTPNNRSNSIIIGVNIIYEGGGTTPAAISTLVKGAATTTTMSTVTSVVLVSGGGRGSVTSSVEVGVGGRSTTTASPLRGAAAASMPRGSGGIWWLLGGVLGWGLGVGL